MKDQLVGIPTATAGIWVALSVLVWLTVGPWAAAGALVLLVADWVLTPAHKVLASAAVALFAAIPLVWLLGSTLPLASPVPRIQDNPAAHQLGGLAVWTLAFAAAVDYLPKKKDTHEA